MNSVSTLVHKVISRCGKNAGTSTAEFYAALRLTVKLLAEKHAGNELLRCELPPMSADIVTMFEFAQSIKRLEAFEKGSEKAKYLMQLLADDDDMCQLYQAHAIEYGLDGMFMAKVFQKVGIKWSPPPTAKPSNHLTMEIERAGGVYTQAYLYVGGLKVAQVSIITSLVRNLCDAMRSQKVEIIATTRPIDPSEVPF